MSFPGSSAGKESICNAGDPVQFLSQEDPLEEGMATHSSIIAWRIPMDRGAWRATAQEVTRVGHDRATKYSIAVSSQQAFPMMYHVL